VRLLHAGDHARHGDRKSAVQIAVVLHPRPGENVRGRAFADEGKVLDAKAERRAHAVVDHLVAVFLRAIEHHRAAPADTAHPRLEHAERKAGCNHRVNAIAAAGEDPNANLGRSARLRGNDAAHRANGGLSDLLEIREVVGHHSSYFFRIGFGLQA